MYQDFDIIQSQWLQNFKKGQPDLVKDIFMQSSSIPLSRLLIFVDRNQSCK